jgi:outer membrane protein TolC
VDTLPSSTSAYNRKIATHNLKQKEVSLKIAQITALDDKKELEQTLFYKKRQIENSLKKVTIAESDMKDMNERFKKGLVTESQVNTQKISLLSAEKTLIENQVSYWDAFLDYIIAIDINLDDVVKVSGAK